MRTAIKEKPSQAKAAAETKPAQQVKKSQVSQQLIAERAYQIWLSQGCTHGQHVENWLRAEKELHA